MKLPEFQNHIDYYIALFWYHKLRVPQQPRKPGRESRLRFGKPV